MSAETNVIGVNSVPGFSYTETFERELSLETNDVLINNDGTFAEDTDIDPINKFSMKGKGDLPDALVAGATILSDGSVIAGATAGKTVVDETTQSNNNEKYGDWEARARNFPNSD